MAKTSPLLPAVLVTRPAHQAQGLCDALRAQGFAPVALPTLTITPRRYQDYAPQLSACAQAGLIIWVSPNAVLHGWRALAGVVPEVTQRPMAAVGASTAQALHAEGVEHVIVPPHPPYNSEALLALSALQAVAGQTVALLRGVGGRALLADTLRERGAKVAIIEVYQRCRPVLDAEVLASLWRQQAVDVMVSTSNESLENLLKLMPAAKRALCLATPLVVVSEVMAQTAKALGFGCILQAQGADSAAIIDALMAWRRASVRDVFAP